ncbi:FHA domain-containing protein [Microbacterium lushaniae]|nr:FHA domain-containing protein [Microbacterium lushaniae]
MSAAPAPARGPLSPDLEDSAVDPEDRVPAAAAQPAGSFTPPPVPPAAAAAAPEPITPISSVPGMRSAPPPAAAPAPVHSVPDAPRPAPEPEPWAPAPVTQAPPPVQHDTFGELSEAVSAVSGAPDAGAPRSARSSVSALYAEPGIGDEQFGAADPAADDEPFDQTVIAKRRRTPWKLIPPSGAPLDISSDVVILGRKPAPDPAYPDAQLVSIPDETRTVSKTHARLELRGETWYVTDLGSTNGVLFATLMGTEVEAQPGQELEAGERFFLGDAEVRLRRTDA